MRHHSFGPTATTYEIAILTKSASFSPDDLEKYYVNTMEHEGVNKDTVIAFDLLYSSKNKALVKDIKSYLNNQLLKALESLKVTTLLCCDPGYFKVLTGLRKTAGCVGYVHPCKIVGYEHMSVIWSPNHKSLFHDPSNMDNIDHAARTVARHVQGIHINFGTNILHTQIYPDTLQEIEHYLEELLTYPELTCDIETFSLAIDKAGIGTIAFAWDQHNGVAFAVDYTVFMIPDGISEANVTYGYRELNVKVRILLTQFFRAYKGKLIYHGSTFDIKILIYELWMVDSLDQAGLIKGLNIMTRLFDDTKVITFLATNSTAGNHLGLKENAHEFAGNYAKEDIHDIRLIPLPDLLRYNLIDCLSTWYVYNKYTPVMKKMRQITVHDEIMLPSIKVILQMELTGMPLNMRKVDKANETLTAYASLLMKQLLLSPIIVNFQKLLQKEEWTKDLLLRQHKAKFPANIKAKQLSQIVAEFNPNSNHHLRNLIYDKLKFPITDRTKSGAASTKGKVLQKILTKLIYEHNIQDSELL